jgi:hypothetical protein
VVFTCNAVLIGSEGIEARIGALGAGKEWLKPWRTISGRKKPAPALPGTASRPRWGVEPQEKATQTA